MKKFAIALVVVAAACGQATGARKPVPIRIVDPGPLALDSTGGLVVGDRALKRVVRIDLQTRKRRIVARSVGVPVAINYDDMDRLYVLAGERIYRIEGSRKVLLAGTGTRSHTGDGGPAKAATFAGAGAFELDHDETIAVAEYDNWIRRIAPDGTISTLAGTGAEGYAGDGGPATGALLLHPHDVSWRIDGLVIADSQNGALRHVDAAGTITTIARGFVSPAFVKGGPLDTMYVADAGANAVYRLDGKGGDRTRIGAVFAPVGMTVDASANVYVSEARRVVRIAPNGRRTVLVKR
jgi:sugar lactone lactonase YvrE